MRAAVRAPLHSAMARLSAIESAGKTDGIWNLRPMPRRTIRCAGRRSSRPAVEAHPTRLRRQLAAQHVEGRGLAGAVRADHAVDAGSLERERQAVEDASPRRRARRRPSIASSRGAAPGQSRRRGDRRPCCRARGGQAALERREQRRSGPRGNSSTTAMKTIAMPISQNGNRSRSPLGQRADRARRRAPGRAGGRGRRPRPRSRGRPRAPKPTSCGVTSPCCGA